MACLDTTVLIDLGRPAPASLHARAVAAIADRIHRSEALYVPLPAEAEFRVGQFRSRDPAAEARRIARMLAPFPTLDFDRSALIHFARSKAYLLGIGRPAGDMDVIVASVALASGRALLTRNRKHFSDIPGLVVESY